MDSIIIKAYSLPIKFTSSILIFSFWFSSVFLPIHLLAEAAVPILNTPQFQEADHMLDAYNQAYSFSTESTWDSFIGSNFLLARAIWENDVNAQISSWVAGVTESDAYNNNATYKDYIDKSLALQKSEAASAWEKDAYLSIHFRRESFLDKILGRVVSEVETETTVSTSSNSQATQNQLEQENISAAQLQQIALNIAKEKERWQSNYLLNLENGNQQLNDAFIAYNENYQSIINSLAAEDSQFQQNIGILDQYQQIVRTNIQNEITNMTTDLATNGYYYAVSCDSNNFCVRSNTVKNSDGLALEGLITTIQNQLTNNDPLSVISATMRDFLSGRRDDAVSTYNYWDALTITNGPNINQTGSYGPVPDYMNAGGMNNGSSLTDSVTSPASYFAANGINPLAGMGVSYLTGIAQYLDSGRTNTSILSAAISSALGLTPNKSLYQVFAADLVADDRGFMNLHNAEFDVTMNGSQVWHSDGNCPGSPMPNCSSRKYHMIKNWSDRYSSSGINSLFVAGAYVDPTGSGYGTIVSSGGYYAQTGALSNGIPYGPGGIKVELYFSLLDVNAQSNASVYNGYVSNFNPVVANWTNNIIPAITNWENQVAEYESSYAAWQANALQVKADADSQFEAGLLAVSNARSKFQESMLAEKELGDRQWKEIETSILMVNNSSTESSLKLASLLENRPQETFQTVVPNVFDQLSLPEVSPDLIGASQTNLTDSANVQNFLNSFQQSILGSKNITMANIANREAIKTRDDAINAMQQNIQDAERYRILEDASDIYDNQGDKSKSLEATLADCASSGGDRSKCSMYYAGGNDSNGNVTYDSANGIIEYKRNIYNGTANYNGGDATQTSSYSGGRTERSSYFVAPASIALTSTGDVFSNWNYDSFFQQNQLAYTEFNSAFNTSANGFSNQMASVESMNNSNYSNYLTDRQNKIEQANMINDLAVTLMTGGTFASWAKGRVEGMIKSQIATAISEATGGAVSADLIIALWDHRQAQKAKKEAARRKTIQTVQTVVAVVAVVAVTVATAGAGGPAAATAGSSAVAGGTAAVGTTATIGGTLMSAASAVGTFVTTTLPTMVVNAVAAIPTMIASIPSMVVGSINTVLANSVAMTAVSVNTAVQVAAGYELNGTNGAIAGLVNGASVALAGGSALGVGSVGVNVNVENGQFAGGSLGVSTGGGSSLGVSVSSSGQVGGSVGFGGTFGSDVGFGVSFGSGQPTAAHISVGDGPNSLHIGTNGVSLNTNIGGANVGVGVNADGSLTGTIGSNYSPNTGYNVSFGNGQPTTVNISLGDENSSSSLQVGPNGASVTSTVGGSNVAVGVTADGSVSGSVSGSFGPNTGYDLSFGNGQPPSANVTIQNGSTNAQVGTSGASVTSTVGGSNVAVGITADGSVSGSASGSFGANTGYDLSFGNGQPPSANVTIQNGSTNAQVGTSGATVTSTVGGSNVAVGVTADGSASGSASGTLGDNTGYGVSFGSGQATTVNVTAGNGTDSVQVGTNGVSLNTNIDGNQVSVDSDGNTTINGSTPQEIIDSIDLTNPLTFGISQEAFTNLTAGLVIDEVNGFVDFLNEYPDDLAALGLVGMLGAYLFTIRRREEEERVEGENEDDEVENNEEEGSYYEDSDETSDIVTSEANEEVFVNERGDIKIDGEITLITHYSLEMTAEGKGLKTKQQAHYDAIKNAEERVDSLVKDRNAANSEIHKLQEEKKSSPPPSLKRSEEIKIELKKQEAIRKKASEEIKKDPVGKAETKLKQTQKDIEIYITKYLKLPTDQKKISKEAKSRTEYNRYMGLTLEQSTKRAEQIKIEDENKKAAEKKWRDAQAAKDKADKDLVTAQKKLDGINTKKAINTRAYTDAKAVLDAAKIDAETKNKAYAEAWKEQQKVFNVSIQRSINESHQLLDKFYDAKIKAAKADIVKLRNATKIDQDKITKLEASITEYKKELAAEKEAIRLKNGSSEVIVSTNENDLKPDAQANFVDPYVRRSGLVTKNMSYINGEFPDITGSVNGNQQLEIMNNGIQTGVINLGTEGVNQYEYNASVLVISDRAGKPFKWNSETGRYEYIQKGSNTCQTYTLVEQMMYTGIKIRASDRSIVQEIAKIELEKGLTQKMSSDTLNAYNKILAPYGYKQKEIQEENMSTEERYEAIKAELLKGNIVNSGMYLDAPPKPEPDAKYDKDGNLIPFEPELGHRVNIVGFDDFKQEWIVNDSANSQELRRIKYGDYQLGNRWSCVIVKL